MIDVVALSAKSWQVSVLRTVGRKPFTVPPLGPDEAIEKMQGHAVLYLRLHGLPKQPYLYGDAWQTALSFQGISQADWRGAVVFLEGCYGIGAMRAFFDGGASVVIGNSGTTIGYRYRLGEAQMVGREFLRGLAAGHTPFDAYMTATRKGHKGWVFAGDRTRGKLL